MKTLSFFMLFIGDPLLVAFFASMLVGVLCKRTSSVIALKRFFSITAFWLYFGLGAAAFLVFNDIAKYIVMFAPLALIAAVVVISLIVAPKGEAVKNDEPYKMSGWDTMFPNDIDNDNSYKR